MGPPEERKGGDVARILGVQDEVREKAKPLKLTLEGSDKNISAGIMPDHVVDTGRPGPTIMVIGDSFTQGYFPLMLRGTAAARSGSIITNAASTGG